MGGNQVNVVNRLLKKVPEGLAYCNASDYDHALPRRFSHYLKRGVFRDLRKLERTGFILLKTHRTV